MTNMTDSIFRLRPADEASIDEIRNHYLWFSKPSGFKDIDDSNVASFIGENESINDSFERIFSNYKEVARLASYTGICCFTESLLDSSRWKHFPKTSNGICIEYDKYLLEQFFQNSLGIVDCFKKIEYLKNPILFDSYSKHDIVWEISDNGNHYKSMNAIEKDDRLMDKLFLKMFTRLSDKFIKQNEVRIILGGSNIPDKSDEKNGYKITIPIEAIKKIHFHPNTPKEIISGLNGLYL